VLAHGWNATSYQILNPGIQHWFSAGGNAVVGYVRRYGVRIVAGAPVCAEADLPAVAAEFASDARASGETICYFGAEARLDALCRDDHRHGMVLLGAQPVWDPERWNEGIASRASVRAQFKRARNKGVLVTAWPPTMATAHPALLRCLREWLATRGLPPLHFLVEPDTLEQLDDRRVFVAERSGEVVAFLVASPVPARTGWLIEQIVRGKNAPNGTSELLVDTAMRTLAAEESRFATLGIVPLSRRAPLPPFANPAWLRFLLAWGRAHGRRFYNFDGLDAFKAKFAPIRWDPIFAITWARPFSPRVLYAMLAAFTRDSPVWTLTRGLLRAVAVELSRLSGKEAVGAARSRPA
jgi:phosphatidylglycerol lysyltransferase